jgi:large repetitive protein
MSVIQYVIRDGAGFEQRGAVNESNSNIGNLALARGDTVSLNLRRADVQDYVRTGDDLELHLADGRTIVLHDFFDGADGSSAKLFLNEDGTLLAVTIDDAGAIRFEEAASWGKWSELDALTFPNDPMVEPYAVADAADAAVEQALVGSAVEEEVTTQALGLGLAQMGIGGLGSAGTVGAAALGGAALLGGAVAFGVGADDDAGGGRGTSRAADPSVDDAGALYTYGGADALMIEVSGTAEPGALVQIQIGGETITVRADAQGNWRAAFAGDAFPLDGSYDAIVTVTNPDGSVVVLDGPAFQIDTIAPDLDAGGNVGMGGNWINAETADGGITLSGTGEPGAEIVVAVEGLTRTTTVRANGTWSVHFAEGVLPGGEYATEVTVTATDAFGNQTVRTESLAIDTVAPDLTLGIVEGDNVVNAAEHADGVVIHGTAEPGAHLVVSCGGAVYQTVAGADGSWHVTFAASDFPEGDYEATVTAVATDRAGNSTTTTSVLHIDTEGTVTIEPGTDGGEPVVNTGNAADGVELSGSAEPGSTVTVDYDGESYEAEVDENGDWTVTVPAEDVASGEYEVEVTVTATDGAGNSTTTTATVTVDTETQVTVDDDYAGSDLLIGADEADAGVTFTGTAEPGATVEVTFEGTTHETTAGADGGWSVGFTPAEIPEGQYDGTLDVTVTDAAGNTASETVTVPVDTTAFVAFAADPVEGDGVVNATEAGDGLVLTGATFPGSTVTVTDGAHSYTAAVAADGSWSVTVPAADLPAGETSVTYTANAVSAAGNGSSSAITVGVDTITAAALDTPIMGDDVVNAAERDAGVTLTGIAEAGSTVMVTLAGTTMPATVAADGSWSATFPASSVPQGETSAPVSVTATDAAGNSTTLTDTVAIDTTTTVSANTATIGGDGIINALEAGAGVMLTGTAEPGASVSVSLGGITRTASVAPNGAWVVHWPTADIPAGETTQPITVTATDRAGNTASTSGSVEIDTIVRNFTPATGPELADGVIAGPERAGGLTLTGTTEPGASVTVQFAGATRAASVAPDGSWSVTFAEGSIPSGEYPTTLTTTTIDRAGNISSASESVAVDTVAGQLTLSAAPIEIDDVVNAAERADGVTVLGTATPGMSVTVGFGTAATTTLAAANGSWSATFPAGDIPAGSWDAAVSASITDAYGNSRSVTDTVRIDTEVTGFATSHPVEGDDVISGAEAADGVTLAGTVEPGSVVSVRLGLITRTADVGADGNWTVDFAAGEIPPGEYPIPIGVSATDAAGNTAMISETVDVDTLVTGFTLDAPLGGDGHLNAAEAAQGLTLTGTVEAGAQIAVTYEGMTRTTLAGADGTWSVAYTAAEVGSGDFSADVTVAATDAVGNTDAITTTLHVDTEAPEPAYVTSYTRAAGDVIRDISVPIEDDVASVTGLAPDGSTPDVLYATAPSLFYPDETDIALGPVPDGTHLVINRADEAGNTSSTLLAMEDSGTDVVSIDNPGLEGVNLDAIDLRIAENSDLTISADLLEGLSANGNVLTVHGSEDDTVHIDTSDGSAFAATGDSVTIGTDIYNVYSLGDEGGTLIIDDEINIVT